MILVIFSATLFKTTRSSKDRKNLFAPNDRTPTYKKTCVPDSGIKDKDKGLHPTVSAGWSHLSMSLLPVYSSEALIWHLHLLLSMQYNLPSIKATLQHAVQIVKKYT